MMVGDALVERGLVRVLGPTAIGDGDATPRQRSLLAALALAGRAGSEIDELADGVWSGSPPPSARSALQNQMTRLRRRHGEDLIICEHTRYRLGRATDVMWFDRELDGSTIGDVDNRIRLLVTALARWRGAPYDDIDSHMAEVERARLLERRALASERLALARLDVGAVEECVVDLRAEVELDPYRDRAWELLVVALSRADRRAEAFLAIDEHTRHMFEEFGAVPSDRILALGDQLRGAHDIDLTDTVSSAAPDLGHQQWRSAPRPCRRRPGRTRRLGRR